MTDVDVSDRDGVVYRYFPVAAGGLASVNLGIVWIAVPRSWYLLLLVLANVAAILFAGVVQVEAIHRDPNRYPEVVRRVE